MNPISVQDMAKTLMDSPKLNGNVFFEHEGGNFIVTNAFFEDSETPDGDKVTVAWLRYRDVDDGIPGITVQDITKKFLDATDMDAYVHFEKYSQDFEREIDYWVGQVVFENQEVWLHYEKVPE